MPEAAVPQGHEVINGELIEKQTSGEHAAHLPVDEANADVREGLASLVSHLRASSRPFTDDEARQLAHLEGIRAHLSTGRASLS